jgi:hypothetical protein
MGRGETRAQLRADKIHADHAVTNPRDAARAPLEQAGGDDDAIADPQAKDLRSLGKRPVALAKLLDGRVIDPRRYIGLPDKSEEGRAVTDDLNDARKVVITGTNRGFAPTTCRRPLPSRPRRAALVCYARPRPQSSDADRARPLSRA